MKNQIFYFGILLSITSLVMFILYYFNNKNISQQVENKETIYPSCNSWLDPNVRPSLTSYSLKRINSNIETQKIGTEYNIEAYVITVDKESYKAQRTFRLLNRIGCNYNIFNAFTPEDALNMKEELQNNGFLTTVYDNNRDQTSLDKALAQMFSHRGVIDVFGDRYPHDTNDDYKNFLFMFEDDITSYIGVNEWDSKIYSILNRLKNEKGEKFDLLFLGSCGSNCQKLQLVDPELHIYKNPDGSFCEHALVFSSKGVEKIRKLGECAKEKPVDCLIMDNVSNGNLIVYNIIPCLFYQDPLALEQSTRVKEGRLENFETCNHEKIIKIQK